MTTYYLARVLLANAYFDLTEDSRECLVWEIPQGKDSCDEIRVVFENENASYTEERQIRNGVVGEWIVSYPEAAKSMAQVINECLRLLDNLGINFATVVGIGYHGEKIDEIEDEIPKRRIQRG